jgi:hypothetical protein
MNTKTTASSLTLSLWKQVVNTFSSFAVEHMGRLYDRQNCLVQSAQVRARCAGASFAAESALSKIKAGGLLAGVLRSDVVLDRGMMVLLEKHVHLQKDVGATQVLVECQESADRHGCLDETYWLRETVTEMKGRARDAAILD